MTRIRAVVFAADELLHPASRAATPRELAAAVAATARWKEVWVVGGPEAPGGAALPPNVRRAAALEQVAPWISHPPGSGTVLVVGSRPDGAIRWANTRSLTGALVVGEPGRAQATALEEVPDFILPGLADVPELVVRLERDEGDFAGAD